MVKKSLLLLAAISVLALLVFVQLGCGGDAGKEAPKDTSATEADSTGDEKTMTNMDDHEMSMGEVDEDDVFACPMHPELTSTDPDAKCPKCGMAMEEVEDDDEDGDDEDDNDDEDEHAGHNH